MSKGKNQWVVPHGKDWAVRGEGNSRATAVKPTQADTVQIAREIARNQEAELIIQNRHGRIRQKDSFGRDPCPPKG